MRAAGNPALSSGTPEQARSVVAAGRPGLGAGAQVRESRALQVPTRNERIPALLLLPEGRPAGLCVYLHGGGWVVGTPADYEVLARALTVRSGCALLVPDYRLAPEHPFPAALEDCEDTLLWAWRQRGNLLGWDAPLIVAGDSAGGNLATVAGRRLAGRVVLAGQALVYPVTDANFDTSSYLRYGTGLPLSREDMLWFFGHYAPVGRWTDPEIAPLHAHGLGGSPPATVALAELDVLRDEGEAYARRLAGHGMLIDLHRYPGVTHGFIRLHNLVDTADCAVTELAEDIGRFAARDSASKT
jgi:acetyl esterase